MKGEFLGVHYRAQVAFNLRPANGRPPNAEQVARLALEEEEKEIAMNPEIKCPNCEEDNLERYWASAPSIGNYKNERSASTIEARKRSYKSHLKKSEDDVRHKFGRLYDDSLNSSAAQRIKKKLTPEKKK